MPGFYNGKVLFICHTLAKTLTHLGARCVVLVVASVLLRMVLLREVFDITLEETLQQASLGQLGDWPVSNRQSEDKTQVVMCLAVPCRCWMLA